MCPWRVLAVGGGLRLLPGFIIDVLGLVCLLPFTRHLAARKMRERAEAQAMRQRAFQDDPFQAQPREGGHRPNVIEGEYERRDK